MSQYFIYIFFSLEQAHIAPFLIRRASVIPDLGTFLRQRYKAHWFQKWFSTIMLQGWWHWVDQWLSLSGHFTYLKMSIHSSKALFLSWGQLSQDTSRSTYSTLSHLEVCVAAFFSLGWFPSFPHIKDGAVSIFFFILLSIHKFKTGYFSPIHLRKQQLKPSRFENLLNNSNGSQRTVQSEHLF